MNFEFRISNKKTKGFTLIEMMVFIFILSLTLVSFYRTFTSATQAISAVKNRLGAVQLANEKMEIIHNLDYSAIGTVGGVPSGNILQYEVLQRDNKTYYVHTFIGYVDDPNDGINPSDTDYKRVRLQVYWEDDNPAKSTIMVGTFTPPGLEQLYLGGILSLHVLDSNGNGVPQANVTIRNNSVTPNIDVSTMTDNWGNLFLPGYPASSQGYSIQVSKSGYFPVQTYAPYPMSTVNPVDIHASVVESSINEKTIKTDKISTINIASVSPLGEAIPNIDFSLEGGRKIADTVASPSLPVFSYSDSSLNTGSSGSLSFSSMSSGGYIFSYGSSSNNDNYLFLHMYPATGKTNTFDVSPDSTINEAAVIADKGINSLLVTVVDGRDNSPIAGASIKLKDPDSAYEVTLISDAFGQVYFPDSSGPIFKKEYKLSVDFAGFQSINDKSINIDKLTQEIISMTIN